VQGAREFHEALGSDDKELIVYEDLYHEVMNEPERDRVIADIVAWLDRHTA
jgi:alpha-beta hydrolase superfamily lysophospholipase